MSQQWMRTLLAACVACAEVEPEEPAVLSIADCSSLCTAWNRSQTAACEADDPDAERCDAESRQREEACVTIIEGDCTPEVQAWFETPPPAVCEIDEAVRSTCDGAGIVGECANGRRVRQPCDAAACPGAGAITLGCRIDPDSERAFCECGCDPDTTPMRCADSQQVAYCAYSALRTERCTDEVCAANGFGRSLGCGERVDGEGCVCEEPCTLADNYCSGTRLYACIDVALEPIQCSDAACRAAGFNRFVRCGAGADGQAACLCQ